MSTSSGKQVGVAFKAVRQCHQDVGRLIADFDAYMTRNGLRRMWNQDAVTSGISRAAYAPYWMAARLYRLYHNVANDPNVVDGINIRFFSDDGSLEEPRLFIGRIRYSLRATNAVENVANPFDLDDGYQKWCNAVPADLGKPLCCDNADQGRVERLCVVGHDLYSLQSVNDVTSLLVDARKQF